MLWEEIERERERLGEGEKRERERDWEKATYLGNLVIFLSYTYKYILGII
jgi:hypothetical protein